MLGGICRTVRAVSKCTARSPMAFLLLRFAGFDMYVSYGRHLQTRIFTSFAINALFRSPHAATRKAVLNASSGDVAACKSDLTPSLVHLATSQHLQLGLHLSVLLWSTHKREWGHCLRCSNIIIAKRLREHFVQWDVWPHSRGPSSFLVGPTSPVGIIHALWVHLLCY